MYEIFPPRQVQEVIIHKYMNINAKEPLLI
jgi:hypothetical protein